jgi:hypothetical protein
MYVSSANSEDQIFQAKFAATQLSGITIQRALFVQARMYRPSAKRLGLLGGRHRGASLMHHILMGVWRAERHAVRLPLEEVAI